MVQSQPHPILYNLIRSQLWWSIKQSKVLSLIPLGLETSQHDVAADNCYNLDLIDAGLNLKIGPPRLKQLATSYWYLGSHEFPQQGLPFSLYLKLVRKGPLHLHYIVVLDNGWIRPGIDDLTEVLSTENLIKRSSRTVPCLAWQVSRFEAN